MRPQRRVDLRRLPIPVQYAIALVVVAIVVVLALRASGGESPSWMTDALAPLLGVLAIVAAVGLLIAKLLRRR